MLLAMMGASGTLLLYRRWWIALPHAHDPPRQDLAALVAATTRLTADPRRCPRLIEYAGRDLGLDRLDFADGTGAYADQTGTIIASWSGRGVRPELWLLDLHRHLLAGTAGQTVAGVVGLAGLGFVLSGMLLWWRTRNVFRPRLLPDRLTRPAILRHHRDLGIVAAPLLLLSFATGSFLALPPLSALLSGPAARTSPPASVAAPMCHGVSGGGLDWSAMLRATRRRFPDAELRSIRLPGTPCGMVVMRLRQPAEWLPNGRTTLGFSPINGTVIAVHDGRALSERSLVLDKTFPLHAAMVGGLAYRLLMTLSGLALTTLGSLSVWSFWLSARSRR